ncbi:MAG: prephenate/arogenate dehydrogenase family protein [Pseudomonadota bacterium]
MTNHLFDRVLIIGIGLIGSSLALAMKRAGLAKRIEAVARSGATRAAALDLGLVEAAHADITAAAPGADLIVIATPVGAIGDVLEAAAAAASPGAILTDVGSVKGAVVAAAERVRDDVHVVPGHPIAGTENSGPHSGFASLFDGRYCLLTPLRNGAPDYSAAVDKVEALWRACGATVERMDATHHDLALAVTSHVPHLIAYNIVGTAADLEAVTEAEVVKYSAGGFRDFTRIAASDPTMWRDVFLNNKEAVLEILGRFTEDLSALQRAIRWGDGEALFDLFTRTRAIRRNLIEAGQESPAPNFGRDQTDTES